MSSEINNVVLFVSDSLRWDYLSDEIADQGTVFKTVAQGGMTAVSFPSLATGLRPQQHGVSSWGHRLPDDVFSVFDLDSINTGFLNSGRRIDGLESIVGADTQTKLTDLDPPFFYLERDNTPHSPHAGFESLEEYLEDRGNNTRLLRQDYEESISKSRDLFERRLDELRDRELLYETLVVFTSDHGELFGEYGELDHGTPLCPELVYVPTVFIHPELAPSSFHADPSSEIIEHVDITATALSLLGHDTRNMAGSDILSSKREQSFGHCFSSERYRGIQFYLANSIWWHEGGYVFTENSRFERLVYLLGHAAKSNRRRYLRRHLPTVLRHYWADNHGFGDPAVTKSEAREQLGMLLNDLSKRDAEQLDLGSDAKETLRDLGYYPE